MYNKNIKGSNNWKEYKVTVPNHENATDIYIGGILSGSGEAWFDDFSVFVDDEPYEKLLAKTDITRQLFQEVKISEFKNNVHIDSNFRIDSAISDLQINNLYELGKQWGYLKYHNPLITSGKYDWDQELFKILPIIKSNNFKFKLNNWKRKFASIKNENANYSHYIEIHKTLNKPVFKNEYEYPNMDWNDTGYKLLSLFRFWNMIQYFYPSKDMTNDWDEVLKEYIPKFVGTNDELSYKLTILELITEINDTHSNILEMGNIIESFFGINIAPLQIKLIQNKLVVINVFDDSLDIKNGDVITHINGKNIERNVNILREYAIGSNESAKDRDICLKLLRTNKKYLDLTIIREEKKFNKEIFCVPKKQINFFMNSNLPSYKELNNNIGYIYLGSLKKEQINEIMEKYHNKKGIIIDLRCYPSDFVVYGLTKHFLSKPTEFAKFSIGDIRNPGEFNFTPALKVGTHNSNYYKGQVVILVNEFTQSQAEYTVMALKTIPGAKVIGGQTAGADGDISKIILPGNISTMISGIGVYYPNGQKTQGIGIIPDIKVNLTIEGIKNNKDEVLEKAIQYTLSDK